MPYVGKKPADIIATAVDTTTGTFSGEIDAASLDISGNIDVDGTTNLDVVDIDGALTQDGGAVFNEGSADVDFRVESNGNANMLFVDGGNNTVHIGQSAPDTTLSGGTPPFQITGSGFSATSAIVRREASSFGPSLMLAKSRNTAVGSHTIVQSGDRLGGIIFIGDDGTDLDTYGATITADCDGTPGANDMPGRLVFSTTADGANSPTERMRIHNGGVVSIPQGIALGVGTANTASNVISDYEEGTWTPALSNYGGTATIGAAVYTKVGRQVTCSVSIDLDGTSDSSNFQITGLPFTSGNFSSTAVFGAFVSYSNTTFEKPIRFLVGSANTNINVYTQSGGAATYNGLGNDRTFRLVIIYFTA